MELIKKNLGIITLIILGCIPLIPLLHSGLPVTHDGQDHVARIANFYQSLSEGNILPRWAANLNWGYGHPILMFLYPLPSYIASAFHFLGIPLVESVKLVFALTYILSGIGMYLWIRNIFGEKAGVLAGVFYMYAPYRFVDMYVRGAIGEHVAFVFAPLIFYFLLKASKKFSVKYIVLGALTVTGLLLSHNALSIMFLPIAAIYALILIYTSSNKKLLSMYYLLFLLLGFGLSSFFIIPAFLEGKYTLRDIVTSSGEYKQGFVSLFDFISFSWSYGGTAFLSKQIGVIQIVGVLLSAIVLYVAKRKKNIALYALLLVSLIGSLLLMLPFSDFIWQHISLIQKFQFPWRLLSVVVFAVSALSGFIFINPKKKKMQLYLVVVLCASCVLLYYPYYKAKGYVSYPETFYTGVYKSTTDTGESSPRWSVRFMEHTALAPAEFIEGNGVITPINRSTTLRTYSVITSSSSARIRENTLYFPNWEVYVNNEKTNIEFQDRANRGLITYFVPKGQSTVVIKFTDTKLRFLANMISAISVLAMICLCIYIFYKGKVKRV